jgi:HAD superfamily hydrolase (TIGR01509 family)
MAGDHGQLQAVLFDMDGLLVNTEPLWFEVEHAVMARLGGTWTPQDQQALVGGSLHRSVDYLLSRASPQAGTAGGSGGSSPQAGTAGGSGGSSPQAGTASRAEVADWLIAGMADLLAEREAALMPGALELLTAVRDAGIPQVLVTSSEQVIMDAVLTSLARHDIGFTATVCGADVSEPKPHPEPYRLAATLLGADPRYCAALEDSPNGVVSALAAGCITIAVPGVAPVEPRPGLLIVPSLADVDLALLRDLAARAALAATSPS